MGKVNHWALLPGLTPETYPRHMLHAEERIWVEKNCYIDVWVEVLHALKLEPMAMLPFVLAVDFEGDQWTFFKPSHDDMRWLYGVDVQELNMWLPLLDHAIEHLASGRLISTESDAFGLPDTSGVEYRLRHTKTTIVINEIDVDEGWAGYFHNAGYFRLEGEDFRSLFRLDAAADDGFLPFYAESMRYDRIVHRPHAELAGMSGQLLRKYLANRPTSNPVHRFAQRFAKDLPVLQEKGLAYYHAWAFGTIRQMGAAFELAELYLRWLASFGDPGYGPAIDAFERIASGNKTLILKAARAATSRKPLDPVTMLAAMADDWEIGMGTLDRIVARG